jgi:prepilin-type N-terminal cleavage/methylation domain-containing protein
MSKPLASRRIQLGAEFLSRRRHGFSLLEMIVAVSLAGVVLSSIAFALHSLQRANSNLQSELAYDVALPRLSAQFRTDAHAAVGLEPPTPEGPAGPIFLRPDSARIEYDIERHHVERRVLQGGRVTNRELYRLVNATAVTWSSTESSPPLLQLRIRRAARDSHGAAGRVDLVEAVLGLDEVLRERY